MAANVLSALAVCFDQEPAAENASKGAMLNTEAEEEEEVEEVVDDRDCTSEWHAQTRSLRSTAKRRRRLRAVEVATAKAKATMSMTRHCQAVLAAVKASTGVRSPVLDWGCPSADESIKGNNG